MSARPRPASAGCRRCISVQGHMAFTLSTIRKIYPDANRCIYCLATETKLTTEHVIPHGIGGRIEFPKASCLSCNRITSARETQFQNEAMSDLKTVLRFPPRKRQVRRGNIRIDVSREDATWERVSVAATQAPSYLLLPIYPEPELIQGSAWESRPVFVGTIFNPKAGLALANKHGKFRGKQIRFDPNSFALMLAKIAHSYAVAEADQRFIDGMTFPLPEMILNSVSRFPTEYVGSETGPTPPAATDSLHEIGVFYGERHGRGLLIVKIRLFAGWPRTPTYLVVVGTRALKN